MVITRASGDGPLSCHVWTPDDLRIVHSVDEVAAGLSDPQARVWVDVEDATATTLARLATILGLHDLVAEDVIEGNQRAKLVVWDESLHLVLFALHHAEELAVIEVDIVLGRRFLLTSHPPTWRPIEALSLDFRGVAGLLGKGTDMLLYAIIDPIVDGYFPVIDRISDEIDELEKHVLAGADASIVERLLRVRRSLLEVRHLVSPEREIFNELADRDLPLIDASRRVYFRDVYNHAIRVTDELDTHRELAGSVLDAYLTTVNNNLSEVMKRLTAITAVLAGVGAAAGVFGMSEAASSLGLPAPLGFWLVVGVVSLIGMAVFAYFRRIDWI
ncbi:magnesium/cobalt transporter CorA [soil metagenome]